jgi:hypothetical protein
VGVVILFEHAQEVEENAVQATGIGHDLEERLDPQRDRACVVGLVVPAEEVQRVGVQVVCVEPAPGQGANARVAVVREGECRPAAELVIGMLAEDEQALIQAGQGRDWSGR